MMAMDQVSRLATEHLLLRMRIVNRTIRRAVQRQREVNRALAVSKAKGLYLSDTHVQELLARADAFVCRTDQEPKEDMRNEDEVSGELEIRRQALLDGQVLPFDRLATLGLTRQEQDALIICAAPELDRAYERIYAYMLDDLTRRTPSVALLSELTSATAVQRAWSLHVFGPFGRLRRRRLLVSTGDGQTEARQEVRLGPAVLDFLLSGRMLPEAVFRDRADVEIPEGVQIPVGLDALRVQKIADFLQRGMVDVIGIWGADVGGIANAVRAVCRAGGVQIRRLMTGDVKCRGSCPRKEVHDAFLACATLHTLLWVEVDRLTGDAGEAALEAMSEQLVVSQVRVILSGKTPWRPTEMIAARRYCELEWEAPGYEIRRDMWRAAAHDVDPVHTEKLAARYRLTSCEIEAATHLARTSAALASNGRAESLKPHLVDACAVVTQRASLSFARVIKPRRRAADLVLPSAVHEQVLEIVRFLHMWPRVGQEWGFSRLDPAAGSLKALFTGDSGTGKTFAAEVIAGEMGAPLIKVDLARVVSKWVGETEKNLAAVFDEARTMHAVLFFDEADALFGRRGEVQRGLDRYANLEVSYLLQRLEEHDAGVVILASNLRDNIDAAFTRRFQVTLHFPRPSQELRRQLWRLAIPGSAPLDGVDFETLARLDLTGGGIVGAMRTAALLAADAGSKSIAMQHVISGVARQYNREARLLNPAELGPFAPLLKEH
jgi:hypothetical protein